MHKGCSEPQNAMPTHGPAPYRGSTSPSVSRPRWILTTRRNIDDSSLGLSIPVRTVRLSSSRCIGGATGHDHSYSQRHSATALPIPPKGLPDYGPLCVDCVSMPIPVRPLRFRENRKRSKLAGLACMVKEELLGRSASLIAAIARPLSHSRRDCC
jgi:hypothetical protein